MPFFLADDTVLDEDELLSRLEPEGPRPFGPGPGLSGPYASVARSQNMTDSIQSQLRKADETQLREIIRLAEAMLQSQQDFALAADQRAMSYAGLLSAVIGIIVSGAFVFMFTDIGLGRVGVLFSVIAGALIYSVFLATESALPVNFYTIGNTPKNWISDIEKEFIVSLAEQAQHYDEMICHNRLLMEKNARKFRWSVKLSQFALLIAILYFWYEALLLVEIFKPTAPAPPLP